MQPERLPRDAPLLRITIISALAKCYTCHGLRDPCKAGEKPIRAVELGSDGDAVVAVVVGENRVEAHRHVPRAGIPLARGRGDHPAEDGGCRR